MTTMRTTLQTVLEGFQTEVGEEPHVYFDPPETVKMKYPCFVYHFDGLVPFDADDVPYLHSEQYSVRYITKTADAVLPKLMRDLPKVSFDRHYTADNLHHHMFTFYSMPFHTATDVDLRKIASSFLGGNNG